MLDKAYIIGDVFTTSYEDAKEYVDYLYRMDHEGTEDFDYLKYIRPVIRLAVK